MEYFLILFYTILFVIVIHKTAFYNLPGIHHWILPSVFVLKVISGCLLGLVYTYYYTDQSTADTFKFFRDSRIIFDTLFTKPYDFWRMFTGFGGNAAELRHYYEAMDAWLNKDVLFNDNKTIIRLNTFFHFFSGGYYFVHVVFINMLSFTGLVALYKTFVSVLPYRQLPLLISTFLIPSVMFWGSGLLKDGLLLFALGLLIRTFYMLTENMKSLRLNMAFLLSLLLLMFTKIYVLCIVVPGLVAWFLSRKRQAYLRPVVFILVYLVSFSAAFAVSALNPKYNLADLIYWKQKNFYVLAENTGAKSVIEIPRLAPTASSIVLNSVPAFFTALTRPWVTDGKGNALIMVSAIENGFLLILLALSLLTMKKGTRYTEPLPLFCLCFTIFMFTLIGLITPVLGALVRYKVPALPFLGFIIVLISGFKKRRSEEKIQEGHAG